MAYGRPSDMMTSLIHMASPDLHIPFIDYVFVAELQQRLTGA